VSVIPKQPGQRTARIGVRTESHSRVKRVRTIRPGRPGREPGYWVAGNPRPRHVGPKPRPKFLPPF
jgi:hypothetical protein